LSKYHNATLGSVILSIFIGNSTLELGEISNSYPYLLIVFIYRAFYDTKAPPSVELKFGIELTLSGSDTSIKPVTAIIGPSNKAQSKKNFTPSYG
jgi:hypothetical protein